MEIGLNLGAARAAGPASPPTHVFLLAGQSNMVGRAAYDGLGDYPAGTLQWGRVAPNNGVLIPATSPLQHDGAVAGDMGLTITFVAAYRARTPDVTVVLVPAAKGGTALSYWKKGGLGYADAVGRANAVIAANPRFLFAGILWHQGESDLGNANYAAELRQMIADMRADIPAAGPACPFVLGTLRTDLAGAPAINAAIEAVPNQLPYTAVADGRSGLTIIDTYHYNAASLRILGGRYDAALAVARLAAPPATAPAQVTGLVLTPGVGEIAAAWSAPANGGAPITDYLVETSPDGAAWSVYADGTSAATTATITGLGNGATRQVRVAAVNAVGTGPASAPAAATTPGVPARVTGLALTAGTTTLAASWTAPAANGSAITDYVVEIRQGSGAWTPVADGIGTATATTIAGLTPGTGYGVRVAAVNALGTGPASTEATATTASDGTAPAQVTGLVLTAGIGEIAAAWTAPANGGAPITDYVVETSPDGAAWSVYPDGTSAATTATITGLGNGATRFVRVAAVNAAGTGPASAPAAATTPDVPARVTGLALTPGTTTLAASWTAPAANGSAITDYVVEIRQGSGAWTPVADGVGTATAATIAGLSPGTGYGVRVAAVNALGAGPASAEATATTATAATAPAQVTGLVLTPAIGEIGAAWSAPANGGAPITDYVVETSPNGTAWSVYPDGTATATTATITGLGNGATRFVRVAAANAVGTGPASAPASATTPNVPAQVTGLTVTPGNTQNALAWSAPAANGAAITDYVIEVSTTSGASWSTVADGTSTATSFAHTGLTNGTTYLYRVSATNAVGTGAASAPQSGMPAVAVGPSIATETGAAGHWVFGSDNPSDLDSTVGLPMTPATAGIPPSRSAGYLTPAAQPASTPGRGLNSPFNAADGQTFAVVFRVRNAADQANVAGCLSSTAGWGAYTAAVNGGTLLVRDRAASGVGNTAVGTGSAGTYAPGSWYFLAFSMASGGSFAWVGRATPFVQAGSGAVTVPGGPPKIGVGDTVYGGLNSVVQVPDIAELIVWSRALTQAEVAAVYARSKTRMTGRGITVV